MVLLTALFVWYVTRKDKMEWLSSSCCARWMRQGWDLFLTAGLTSGVNLSHHALRVGPRILE
jgi:hypothetical protein